jgi:hypothetical protein
MERPCRLRCQDSLEHSASPWSPGAISRRQTRPIPHPSPSSIRKLQDRTKEASASAAKIRPARQALLGRRPSILVRMATIPYCGHARNGGALAYFYDYLNSLGRCRLLNRLTPDVRKRATGHRLHCEISFPNKKLRDLRIPACVLSSWQRTVHELIEV